MQIFVESLETYEFNALADGRTEHRWLLRSIDRSPEGMAAFDAVVAVLRELSADASWGDQMRVPIADDAEMYGMNER